MSNLAPDTRRRTITTAPDDSAPAYAPTRYATVVKPVLDRTVGLVLLLLLIPVLLLCAAAVFVDLGRPVLFRQVRVGRHGQHFTVLKFRTMRPDLRRVDVTPAVDRRQVHKSKSDPRITRLGAALRKSSLDELPQLVNVVRGQMSLVGPRPELPSIVARYRHSDHVRHVVKPGLTGLWQVTARGDGLMHEHVDTDLQYVRSMSASNDLRIMLRTVAAVWQRPGF